MNNTVKKQPWLWVGLSALFLIVVLLVTSFLSKSTATTTNSYGGVGGEMIYQLDYAADEAKSAAVSSPDERRQTDGGNDALSPESYIIKTGSINMRVDSVNEAMVSLEEIAATHSGYISYSYLDRSEQYVDGYATVRVMADAFDAAMADIQTLATSVRYVSVSSDDVTEQVIDVQARLSNAQAEEQSYLDVLDLATSVEDILEVRRYLSQVRESIERYEAQLEYYESVTSMATISVEMTEETSLILDSETFRPSQSIIDAAQTVIRLAQSLVIAFIWIVVVGGAILIPAYVLWHIGRAIYRRMKK